MTANKISTKTKYIRTDGWRGYVQPINAVGGANDTGSWEDSPCPTSVCKAEIKGFQKKLKAAGISSKVKACETSNVFCMHVYVLVAPEDHDVAYVIAQEHAKETRLFYAVSKGE